MCDISDMVELKEPSSANRVTDKFGHRDNINFS
jgi:hypothetical protein